MRRRVLGALLAGSALLFASQAARAQPQMSEGEKKASARAAFNEGVELQDKGKPAEALKRFEAAESLFDAPTHLLHIAECQALTGKLVEARETYTTLDGKDLEGQADVFKQAQAQGHAELAVLTPRIPSLKVVIQPDPAMLQNLVVTLNDQQLPGNVATIMRPVNPGTYRATATATGYATPQAVTFTIAEKEPRTVELVLVQGAIGASIATTPAGTETPPPPQAPPPPYEQPDGGARPRPTFAGLLFGAKFLGMVPAGNVYSDQSLGKYTGAGPGFGLEGYLRFVRILMAGLNFEWASLAGADPATIPAGTSVHDSTHMYYIAPTFAIVPNIDRVSFVGDVGVGYRHLSRSETVSNGVSSAVVNQSFGGLDLALGAGLSIPAGPVRIIPKAALSFGSFSGVSCGGVEACKDDSSSSGHVIFTVSLGIDWSLNLGKKPTGQQAPLR